MMAIKQMILSLTLQMCQKPLCVLLSLKNFQFRSILVLLPANFSSKSKVRPVNTVAANTIFILSARNVG